MTPPRPTSPREERNAQGPFMVRSWTTFGGNRLHYNRHDDFPSAEREAILVAQGKWDDEELDGIWIEDLSGDVVWSVGKAPRRA